MTTTLVVTGLMNICECIFGTSGRFALNRRPNPPLEQSFDQLEDEPFEVLHCWVLLDEEKIGGEIVVSLLDPIGHRSQMTSAVENHVGHSQGDTWTR